MQLLHFKLFKKIHTIGISNHFGVAEPDRDGQAQEHENPVHLRYVDLAVDLAWCVHDLNPREAPQGPALAYDRKRSWDDGLAPNNCG